MCSNIVPMPLEDTARSLVGFEIKPFYLLVPHKWMGWIFYHQETCSVHGE